MLTEPPAPNASTANEYWADARNPSTTIRTLPALGWANGVAPLSPSAPRKRTRAESTPLTAHVTIADKTLFAFAATVTRDTTGADVIGANPSRHAAQQTKARAFCHESFIVRSVATESGQASERSS
jgi:hypothetical protein